MKYILDGKIVDRKINGKQKMFAFSCFAVFLVMVISIFLLAKYYNFRYTGAVFFVCGMIISELLKKYCDNATIIDTQIIFTFYSDFFSLTFTPQGKYKSCYTIPYKNIKKIEAENNFYIEFYTDSGKKEKTVFSTEDISTKNKIASEISHFVKIKQ